ncbi:MAG: tetratricopeptide repeat protein [Cyclobacteriaceae bacterium]|nr:tetratricopeptide repeat protein [Cyclobacteriaceae bacterium HetDA_MAG_MS6]
MLAALTSSPALSKVDSLITLLDSPDQRLVVLDELCFHYRHIDYDSVIFYGSIGYNESRIQGEMEKVMLFADYLGSANYKKARYDQAVKYYTEALIAGKQIQDSSYLVSINNALGVVYFRIGDLEQAAQYMISAINIAEIIGDSPRFISSCLQNLGSLQFKLNQNTEAKDYFNRALRISASNGDSIHIGNIYHNLGVLYKDGFSKLDSAQGYFELALDIRKQMGRGIDLARTLNSYGRLQEELTDYKKAITQYREAIIESQKVGSVLITLAAHHNTSRTFSKLRYYKAALEYAELVGYGLDSIMSLDIKKDHEKLLSNIYEALGQYSEALIHQKQYQQLKDSLMNGEKAKVIANLEWRYKIEGNERTIAQLKAEGKVKETQSKVRLWVIIIICIFLSALIYVFYLKTRLNRQRAARLLAENRQRELELDLKHQELSALSLNLMSKNNALSKVKEKVQVDGNENVKDALKVIDANFALDEDWGHFKMHFEKVHHGFFERLKSKYPTITLNEEKLCAYLLINLSSKEIARLSHSSLSAIEKSRYRLRKKLGLTTEANLHYFLRSI